MRFRSDRQPRLFLMSLAGAVVAGVAAWFVIGHGLIVLLAALIAFGAVTFGVGGLHRDGSVGRLRQVRDRRPQRKGMWW
jgi:hypothetical protein